MNLLVVTADNYDVVLFESVLLAGYRLPEGESWWRLSTVGNSAVTNYYAS